MLNIFKKTKQSLGAWGEDYIAKEYKKKGYKILDKNYFNRKGKQLGEIDFIALKDKDLAFVEVKTRTNTAYGRPGESVDFFKQQKLVRASKKFIQDNPAYKDFQYHIDVAELICDLDRTVRDVNILVNAVEDTL